MLDGEVVEGTVPEYALVQRHYYGDEQAAPITAGVDVPPVRTVLRPSYTGVPHFSTRFPPARSPTTSSREDADGHLCPDPRRR